MAKLVQGEHIQISSNILVREMKQYYFWPTSGKGLVYAFWAHESKQPQQLEHNGVDSESNSYVIDNIFVYYKKYIYINNFPIRKSRDSLFFLLIFFKLKKIFVDFIFTYIHMYTYASYL